MEVYPHIPPILRGMVLLQQRGYRVLVVLRGWGGGGVSRHGGLWHGLACRESGFVGCCWLLSPLCRGANSRQASSCHRGGRRDGGRPGSGGPEPPPRWPRGRRPPHRGADSRAASSCHRRLTEAAVVVASRREPRGSYTGERSICELRLTRS